MESVGNPVRFCKHDKEGLITVFHLLPGSLSSRIIELGSHSAQERPRFRMKNGCKPDQDLLIDEPAVREALNRLVIRIERNHHTQEDLFQEAWVHFWSREQ